MESRDNPHIVNVAPHKRQTARELFVVIVSLALLVWFYPLGTEGFEMVTSLLCAGVLLYVTYGLVTSQGIAERWGFPFSQPPDPLDSLRGADEDIFGYLLLGGFFLVGAVPMLVVKVIAPQPIFVSQPALYLLWCGVQDFLFFALILRNLEDWIDPFAAVPITALLFGLSHYPYSWLMALTIVAGGVWGYAFIKTRSLMLVTLSHWIMGIVLFS